MSDDKLRCALVYRIDSEDVESSATVTVIAKYDHAADYEAHAGATTESFYGGRDKDYAEAVEMVISNDPPDAGTGTEPGSIGGFKVVQSDSHQVVYGADSEGLCLAVITGLRYPSRVATQMLVELHKDYSKQFGGDIKSATSNSLTRKSKPILTSICTKYSNLGNVDKASALVGKVNEVKSQMQDNIASMLSNIEKTEDISDQANSLNEQASVFKKKSVDLRNQMRCKNLKMTLLLVGLVTAILAVILIPLIVKAKNASGGGGGGGENDDGGN